MLSFKMSFISGQDNDGDRKHCEIRQGNATARWNSDSTTFDLANHFTHNPRLMSPSNFRTPLQVPSLDGNRISFDKGMSSGAFDMTCSDVRASTPNCQSSTNSSPTDHNTSRSEITSSQSQLLSFDDQTPSMRSLTPNVDGVDDRHFSLQDHSISSPEHFFSPEEGSVSVDHQIFSPHGQTYSPSEGHSFSLRDHSFRPMDRRQNMSVDDKPSSPQGQTESLEGQIPLLRGHTSSPEGQILTTAWQEDCILTTARQEDCKSTKPADESGISLFSETKFNTSDENSGDDDEQGSVSGFSDSSSSKLNWSLSTSYSSSAASICHSDRGRSLSDNTDGSLSSAVCARRRRRRRSRSFSSASTTSQDGTQVISSASYFRDYAEDEGALTFSQCPQEVWHTLDRAPVALVTPRDQSAIGHSSIKYYDGYHRRPKDEVMNWDEFETPGKVYPRPPMRRKHLIPFYPHGNSSCNASHCLQKRRRRGFKKSHKIVVSRDSPPEVPSASYDEAWPSLPSRISPQTTNLLNDPAILSVGKAVQNREMHLPQDAETVNVNLRSVDSKKALQNKHVSLSYLLKNRQPNAPPSISSTEQHDNFDMVLQDPAVLHVYRQNDTMNSTLPCRLLENRFSLHPQREGCRCCTMSIADDPAILGVGTPMYSKYAAVSTHITNLDYCYYFGLQ